MSIKIMSKVWDSGPPDPMQRLVLLAIADHADEHGRAYPSMVGIASKCGMTERGTRGIIRKLEANGWLETKVGGGRGGKSYYTVKPEPETRNDKPGMTNPESERPKTRNESAENPERGSPEPSGTIKEPSESNNAREISAALEQWASPEAVRSFISYRRKQKGKALSLTAAKRQAMQLKAIFQGGGDTDDALGMAEERGWQSIQADWYFKAAGASNDKGTGTQKHSAAHASDRSIAVAAGFARTPSEDCF